MLRNPFASADHEGLRYVTAVEAQAIDDELMSDSPSSFTLDQLMELAGLSVAEMVLQLYPLGPALPPDANGIKQRRANERVLVCCGPGNQGGDGLVAARHLYQFGYAPSIFYPKEGKNPHYARLRGQCENLGLPLIAPAALSKSSFPMAPDAQINAFRRALGSTDVVLDAIFGFSYKPPSREPFTQVLAELKTTTKPIVSVDIPSGWDVAEGNIHDTFTPTALISLTAPKEGVRAFAASGGQHWLGGRFMGQELADKYDLKLPTFPGSSQCVNITRSPKL